MATPRDDGGARSVSTNERSFVRTCATASVGDSTSSSSSSVLRLDGRHPGEIRSIQLSFGRTSLGRAECTVRLGPTRVAAVVTCDLIPPPSPDVRPNDGTIKFGVDLSPMASMSFDPMSSGAGGGLSDAETKLTSNRIARVIERTVRDGGALDVESLCVIGGEWVWRLNVDVTALDDGGNLMDAGCLSAIAALRHFRKPEVMLPERGEGDVDADDDVPVSPVVLSGDEREATPLPLHHTPVTVSFALFAAEKSGGTTTTPTSTTGGGGGVAALLDPSDREELYSDGVVTYAFNRHGELCAVDFPGGCELSPRQLVGCANLAQGRAEELCDLLEEALKAADGVANEERMVRLRAAALTGEGLLGNESGSAVPPEVSENVPFVVTNAGTSAADGEVDTAMAVEAGAAAAALAAAEEEERYRLRALDYALCHEAAKVKEDDEERTGTKGARSSDVGRNRVSGGVAGRVGGGGSSSLIDAMIRRAGGAAPAVPRKGEAVVGGGVAEGMDGDGDGASSSSPATAPVETPRVPTTSSSSGRTREADDEFERFAGAAKASSAAAGAAADQRLQRRRESQRPQPMDLEGEDDDDDDDEEEEEVTVLRSEFDAAPAPAGGVSSSPDGDSAEMKPAVEMGPTVRDGGEDGPKDDGDGDDDDDDDVDDLAMAVVKKKKKPKKSSSKKDKNKDGDKKSKKKRGR